MTPLQEHNKLIAKILHTRSYDPELSATRIAKRHGCDISFVKRALKGEVQYPGYYRKLSKQYKLPVELIQEQMEQGKRYCPKCETFCETREFRATSGSSWRHLTAYCEPK